MSDFIKTIIISILIFLIIELILGYYNLYFGIDNFGDIGVHAIYNPCINLPFNFGACI